MATIDVLANMGLDALGNHFQVVIPVISQLGASVASLNMRILTIDIPEKAIDTYDITKRGRKMSRPSGVSGQSNDVTFSFRNDKYWQCYNALVNWMNYIQNNKTMSMASDSGTLGVGGASEFRHNIEIWSLTSLDGLVPNNIWIAEGAYPKSLDGISFDEDSGDPITTSCTLNCMAIQYPSLS